jgi:lantibiotic modifying enzyme
LTGFSHGAAGFAYSLLRLYQVTGQQRFREAAIEAIAYENNTYSHDQANWPDLRTFAHGEEPKFSNTWCHGATGIGLARLGGLEVLDNPIVRSNMDQAVAAALAVPLTDYDHVCCGNFGRIDFLLEAGRRLDRPSLVKQANLRASQLVRRAESEGRFRLHASVPKAMENVSFFQGLSGIGYQLLRMIEPQQLPCVLLWD